MKILSAPQIQAWDAYTIEHEPIPSIMLMERAAQACTDWITGNNYHLRPAKIFCGKGNNGGDGLAIARQLISLGVEPFVYILEFGALGTKDFQENLHKLHQLTSNIYFIQSAEFFPRLEKGDLVIDALFGSGLNRPLKDLSEQLVQHINSAAASVVSIDVPSGIYLDTSSKGNTIIEANHTLTFQCLKLCLMVAENAQFFGEVHVLDIGLAEAFTKTIETKYALLTGTNMHALYRPRKSFSHKGTFGHALLVAGNKGKMGAAVLAAKACLRAGVGLLTCSVPMDGLNIMQTSVHEAMALIRGEEMSYEKYTTIGIGPGLGTGDDAKQLVLDAISNHANPMIVDADALNVIARNQEWLSMLPENSIITPHPKEFERLVGACANDFERMEKAIGLSNQQHLVVVLKGHYTLIAFKGKGYFNSTGNAGMATGGSGDILTGILTSLVAQHYHPFDAACLGIYLHGLAADLALADQSEESLLPTDMVAHLGKAFKTIAQ